MNSVIQSFGDVLIDDVIDELELRRNAAYVGLSKCANESDKADGYRNLISVLDRMLEAAV